MVKDLSINDAVIYFHDVARKLEREGDGELARDIRIIADRLNEKSSWSSLEELEKIRKAI